MLKRLFLLLFGLGLGLVVGAWFVRRMNAATDAMAPSNVAASAGRAASSFAERFRDAVAEGRVAAADREAELRSEFHVPTLRQALQGD